MPLVKSYRRPPTADTRSGRANRRHMTHAAKPLATASLQPDYRESLRLFHFE